MKFLYGKFTYEYELVRSDRKTLSLTVRPNLSIIVKSPLGANQSKIETFLKRKWLWINKQLNYFKQFQKSKTVKNYVAGESFLYLGRQYQLVIKEANEDRVVLQKGKLIFYSSLLGNKNYTKRLVDIWYKIRTKQIFEERYLEVWKNFNYQTKPMIAIKKMSKKWGSCARGKYITLNPLLILASKDCIDYVITHELCHLKYKNHDKRFYALLDAKYPKWERVKEKLELRFA